MKRLSMLVYLSLGSVAWAEDSASPPEVANTVRYSQLSAQGPAAGAGRIGLSLGALVNTTEGLLPSLQVDYARGLSERWSLRGQALLSNTWGLLEFGTASQFLNRAIALGVHGNIGSYLALHGVPGGGTSAGGNRVTTFSALPYVTAGVGAAVAWSRLTVSLNVDALFAAPRLTGARLAGDVRGGAIGFRGDLVFDVRVGQALTLFAKVQFLDLANYSQLGLNFGVGW